MLKNTDSCTVYQLQSTSNDAKLKVQTVKLMNLRTNERMK